MCPTMDTSRTGTTHHPSGSPGQCPDGTPFTASHHNRQHTQNQHRRSVRSLGLEKRVKGTTHQQPHPPHANPGSSKTHQDLGTSHSRGNKQKSRLAVTTPRPKVVPAQPHHLPQSVPTLQLPPQHRSVCEPSQQTSQTILQLEGRHTQQRQCIPGELESVQMLAQSTLGHHHHVPAEGAGGQSNSTGMHASLDVSPMVDNPPEATADTSTDCQTHTPVPKSRRGGATPTTLGDPF